MDDDPWGSSSGPWNTSTSDKAALQGDDVVNSSPEDSYDAGLSSSPRVPARGNSFSESDPWASPVKSQTNPGTIPSPIAVLNTELSAVNLPDLKDEVSLPKAEWVTEDRVELSNIPDLKNDLALPKVQWDTTETADDNAWSTPKASPLPVSRLIIDDPPLQFVRAEHVPLPDDEHTYPEDGNPSRLNDEQASGDMWTVPRLDDEGLNEVSVNLPPPAGAPLRFAEEDENFNPFNQENQIPPEAPEASRALATSPHDDEDDAFGGFASAGIEESNDQPGFATVGQDDAYGGGWGNEEHAQGFSSAWGSSTVGDTVDADGPTAFQVSSRKQNDESIINDDEGGFHSVPAKWADGVTAEQLKEDEWEAARRRIVSQEARAPVELITKLADKWKDVLHQVFTISEPLDAGKEVEDGLDPESVIRKDRLMRKLTELPDGMSFYVQPTQNTVTWALYQEYLTTVKLDPSASILAKASAESAYRAARRKSQEDHDAWQARSRLGESGGLNPSPHSTTVTGPDVEGARPKWSLWGRKTSTATVPLTTSGGGMLEVKDLSPNHPGTPSDSQSRTNPQIGSIPTSSRSTPPPIRSSESNMPSEHDLSGADPAPSAVGRFLGRFRRPKMVPASSDVSNKDLEISQDDFSFLADVPALPTKPKAGVVDLVSFDDSKPTEQMASLEAMLNSTPLPLPPHLNPPPRPSASRGNSRASSTISNVPSHTASKSNSMIDLFGNLDLSNTAAPKPSTLVTSGLGLDDLMKPANSSVVQQNQLVQTPAMLLPNSHDIRTVPKHSAYDVGASSSENYGFVQSKKQSQGKISNAFDMDDFGDFEQFQNNPIAKHATTPTISYSARALFPNQFSNPPRADRAQASPSRLDHSSTAKLVETAAQNSSKWPASVSPSIPTLPPPTSVNTRRVDTVLTPPTSGSRTGTPLNFDFLAAGPTPVAPSRMNSASPALSLLANAETANRPRTPPQLSKGQGLSASDLSFFDSL